LSNIVLDRRSDLGIDGSVDRLVIDDDDGAHFMASWLGPQPSTVAFVAASVEVGAAKDRGKLKRLSFDQNASLSCTLHTVSRAKEMAHCRVEELKSSKEQG